jgi:hypothetical protein
MEVWELTKYCRATQFSLLGVNDVDFGCMLLGYFGYGHKHGYIIHVREYHLHVVSIDDMLHLPPLNRACSMHQGYVSPVREC